MTFPHFTYAIVAALTLTACATQPAKLPAPTPTATCLPLKAYTPDQQKQAAAELAKLPNGSVIAQMVTDYGTLRDVDRAACQK
jgi:starvation-inducible outer membrane lipoprotein